MKRFAIVIVVAVSAATFAIAAQTTENVDAATIAKIRDEGLSRSKVMDTLFWLSDRYGPRLTGSPGFEAAGDWAVKRLTDWGVTNVHKERWAFGRGWQLANFHATMTEPQVMAIIGVPKSWTPGTKGTIVTEVVRPVITSQADCEKYKGHLKGKIILTQPERAVAMLDKGEIVMRYDDHDGKWLKEALAMPAPRGRGAGGAGRGGAGGGRGGANQPAVEPDPDPCVAIGLAAQAGAGRGAAAPAAADPADPNAADAAATPAGRGGAAGGGAALTAAITRFYKAEGVAALFDRGGDAFLVAGGSDLTWQAQHVDGGTFIVQSGGRQTDAVDANLPQVTLAVEHYNRMVRLLEHDIPVKVELNIDTRFNEETPGGGGFNIIGDIPGSDLKDEIVMIGAHFDSWHGGTGATDNASGSAAMMEVMRLIKAIGLQPRRTIRIGLWGGEEQGVLGSRAYATSHFGTLAEPKPELGKMAAYYNLDNGTGKIRGIWMQANPAVKPIFEQWIAPLKDLGVDILGPRSVTQTDHVSFDPLGVPAFQFVQERYEYNSRTHHTNMDLYDRVQKDDMMQIATVAAVFVWQSATRDEMLPRKPVVVPAAGGRGGR